MPRPVHFEISAEDPDATARFYEQALGWSVRKWEASEAGAEYWLIDTGEGDPGINGGMTRRGEQSLPGTTLTLSVPELEAAIAAVEGAGGTLVMAPMDMPGVGRLAYITDPAGNAFGLLQAAATG